MKKNITAVILACVLALSGCTKSPLPELQGDAIAFEMGTFIDDKHDVASFGTIEYNGRTYIAYGTTNNKYKQSYIESCIGYYFFRELVSSRHQLILLQIL